MTERFWERVAKSDGCWIWTGKRDQLGYGFFSIGARIHRAHRVALEFALGRPIAPGMFALHACDNPPCVRVGPEHVHEGTARQNIQDMLDRGRSTKGIYVGEKNHHVKLTEAAVYQIRQLYARGRSRNSLAREFGVSWQTIERTVRRLNWAHLP